MIENAHQKRLIQTGAHKSTKDGKRKPLSKDSSAPKKLKIAIHVRTVCLVKDYVDRRDELSTLAQRHIRIHFNVESVDSVPLHLISSYRIALHCIELHRIVSDASHGVCAFVWFDRKLFGQQNHTANESFRRTLHTYFLRFASNSVHAVGGYGVVIVSSVLYFYSLGVFIRFCHAVYTRSKCRPNVDACSMPMLCIYCCRRCVSKQKRCAILTAAIDNQPLV